MSAALPDDLELKKTRIVALINLEKYEEALNSMQGFSGFDFEKSYVLYKLQQFNDSLEISRSRNEKPFRLLRAQTVTST